MKHLTIFFMTLSYCHLIVVTNLVEEPVKTTPIKDDSALKDCDWIYYCLKGDKNTGRCTEVSAPILQCSNNLQPDHIIDVATCQAGHKKDVNGRCRKVWKA